MFFVIISISIYNFGIYLILVLSNCNAIQSTDCHVRYFNKLSIYLSIYLGGGAVRRLSVTDNPVFKLSVKIDG